MDERRGTEEKGLTSATLLKSAKRAVLTSARLCILQLIFLNTQENVSIRLGELANSQLKYKATTRTFVKIC